MDLLQVRRRARQLVLVIYITAMLGVVAMVFGPFLNDRTIEDNPGRALAQVTNVGSFRTTVDYQDEKGLFHSPATGLLYPTGLGEGQRVWVNYAKSDPELVKVEGRKWTLSIIPALSVGAVATVIGAVLWLGVGRIGRRSENATTVD
ncbi:hypothetical protein CDES_02500 [Corynebacterium deserti GIMN1.010]|uniref:DUF3592 domain-containing protein n=1 Tax=Corynebacterium deserti GIMN1.010 TaxID=931089 RepID=A0A0M4CK83_9CORY|nr:DUF3592 domain-containing protein [Corynebacterium deserti]ALC04960.1 hypothetical protein CDES_02500 [Corynebacterium deserti GIMN1.010]